MKSKNSKEYKIEQLSKLMLDVVYPKLMETMKHIGINETEICLENYDRHYLTVEGKLYWINEDGELQGEYENIIEYAIDPQLQDIVKAEEEERGCYTSPIEVYYEWCENVLNIIEELQKKHFKLIDELINKINKIQTTYTRKIITEKAN